MTAGLLAAFLDRARLDPEYVQFVTVEGGRANDCTLGSLESEARRYARLCRELGCGPGDVVFIALKPGPAVFHAFLGALIAGCIPSMMPFPSAKQDPSLFWGSHRELFAHNGGGAMITYVENVPALRDNIPPHLLRVAVEGDQAGLPPLVQTHAWSGAEVCCLQHSSGTTGLKKV